MMRKTIIDMFSEIIKKTTPKQILGNNNVVKKILKKLNRAHFAYLVTSLFRTSYVG